MSTGTGRDRWHSKLPSAIDDATVNNDFSMSDDPCQPEDSDRRRASSSVRDEQPTSSRERTLTAHALPGRL